MATYGPTNCSYDSYVNQVAPTNKNGAATTIQISWAATAQKCYGLFAFDVSTIPAGATVSSASLFLDFNSGTLAADGTGAIYPMTQAWVEADVTYNKYNATTDWPGSDINTNYDTGFGDTFTFTKNVDLTISCATAVQKALTSYRSGNYIYLLVKQTNDLGATSQASYFNGLGGIGTPAQLTVNYTTGYGAMLLTGAGA